MKRIGQITYEFTEEEYKDLLRNVEEVTDFLKGYVAKERAEDAVHNLKHILIGEEDE